MVYPNGTPAGNNFRQWYVRMVHANSELVFFYTIQARAQGTGGTTNREGA